MSATGRCLCGKVSFTTQESVEDIASCHCDMCRRWSGSPALSAFFETEVKITGEENLKWYQSSDWAERGFCTVCGSSLFYRVKGEQPIFSINAGAFDDQSRFKLHQEYFIDEKPAYYAFAGDIPAMTGEEVFAMYAPQSNDCTERNAQ